MRSWGYPLLSNRFTVIQNLCEDERCDFTPSHMAKGPQCIFTIEGVVQCRAHQCSVIKCSIVKCTAGVCSAARYLVLNPDTVLSHGLDSRGQPRMNTQAGSQAALPSEADEVNTHMGHSSSIREWGEEQVDWEISSYTCSSLMKEVIKIKDKNIATSQIKFSPAPPHPPTHLEGDGGGARTVGVCTDTVQTLYSLHRLSPAKCAAIQNWLDTNVMYGRPSKNAVLQASKGVQRPSKNAILQEKELNKILLEDFPNHTLIDVFLPNFKHRCMGKLQLGNIGGEFYPNILYVCDSGSSENMITSQLLNTIYPNFNSLLAKCESPLVYSCTKTPLNILGILNTHVTIGGHGFQDHFLVYECPHPECLLGLRTLQEQQMVITSRALLLHKSKYFGDVQNCRRLGPLNAPIFDVEVVTPTLIPPYTAVIIRVKISSGQVTPKMGDVLKKGFVVVHSEEFQASTPQQISKMDIGHGNLVLLSGSQPRFCMSY